MNSRYFDRNIGYWKVKAPDHPSVAHLKPKHQYVLEHRIIMEEILGRYLKSEEFVLHKDGDKTNNDLDNLILGDSKTQNKVHKRVRDYIKRGGDRQVFTNKDYL